MKQLLASQELLHPRLFPSLLAALKPIMGINKTGVNARTLFSQLMDKSNQEDEDIDGVWDSISFENHRNNWTLCRIVSLGWSHVKIFYNINGI